MYLELSLQQVPNRITPLVGDILKNT